MSLVYTPPIWDSWSEEDLHALAADPSTSSDVLVELWEWASFMDEDLRGILASNPAVPSDILLQLTQRHAAAVTRNPAFLLLISTVPGFLQGLHPRVLRRIGRAPGVDPRLLVAIGSQRSRPPNVRAAVASNPDCPVDLMRAFLKHAFMVRDALAKNPALPDDLVAILAGDKSADVRATIARRDRLSGDLRVKLSCDGDPGVRAAIAQRRDTAVGTLVRMVENEWAPEVLDEIIRLGRTPIEAIVPLTRHRSYSVQCAIRTWCPEVRSHPMADIDPETGMIAGEAELRFKPRHYSQTPALSRIPDWVLGAVIDHGWKPTKNRADSLQRFGVLNREPFSYWPPVGAHLQEEEYFALLRGMIYLENTCQEWFAGSVASTIFLAKSMIQMYPHRGVEVRAFITANSKNTYLWGLRRTHAELTPEERVIYAEREMQRRAQYQAEEKRERERAIARAKARALELARKAERQRYKAEQRIVEHQTLKSLAPPDRLIRIAGDTTVTMAYFSPEWGEISDADLCQVPSEILETLAARCRLKSSRTWSRVGTRIGRYLTQADRTEAAVPTGPKRGQLSTVVQVLTAKLSASWRLT